ncbi:sulfatase [Lewinella sp. JB7]|nr:sulfatase [Lewinella sp. JB7]
MVFILADDLGYSDLGCMGSDFYETPNIDALAAMGATFVNGYANCQVCSPSRASLLTGQFATAHGITDWIGARAGTDWTSAGRHDMLLPAQYVRALPDSLTVLSEAFRGAGYRTFFAGKWHLGGQDSWPTDHGFEVNVGGYDSGSPRGGFFDPYDNPNLPDRRPGENLSLRLARETADFITQHRDTSFFAYLSFYAVHAPIQSTREKWDKYRKKAIARGIEDQGFAMERVLPYKLYQDQPVYGGLVEQMDDAVGIVLDTLRAQGLLENTIIVFTSDNGGVVSGDGYATNLRPLRGGKGYQWEGGIKVPYIIYAPGTTVGGSRPEATVTGADLYPTLLDLAGLPLRPEVHHDGTSLAGVIAGDSLPQRELVWHYPHYGNQGGEPSSILRRGEWKLIHYYEDGRNELYHLASDPGEASDLSGKETERAATMYASLLDHLNRRQARLPTSDPTYSAAARQRVRDRYRDELMPWLEAQRKARYEADWEPNADWWGSQPD